jgi:hypothetical protein
MPDVFQPFVFAQLPAGLDSLLLWAVLLTPFVLLVGLGITYLVAFDIAKTIVTTLGDIFKQITNLLKPPTWDSWQCLVWISVFCWAVSLLPQSQFIQRIIASTGWLFLIPGIHWFMHIEKLNVGVGSEINIKKGLTINGLYIAPWITGALICMFLFGGLAEHVTRWGVVAWPIVSTAIAVAPKFIQFGPTYKVPEKAGDRQDVILLVLSNLLLSCWLQLSFATQEWVSQYPSLTAADLKSTTAVIKFDSSSTSSRGVLILEQTCRLMQQELDRRSWSWVERWLLNLDQQLVSTQTDVMEQISQVPENDLWEVKGKVAAGTEYTVRLFAIWKGPTVDGKGYYLTKDVYISKVPGSRVPISQQSKPTETTGLASVSCDETLGPFVGKADLENVRAEKNYRRIEENNKGLRSW